MPSILGRAAGRSEEWPMDRPGLEQSQDLIVRFRTDWALTLPVCRRRPRSARISRSGVRGRSGGQEFMLRSCPQTLAGSLAAQRRKGTAKASQGDRGDRNARLRNAACPLAFVMSRPRNFHCRLALPSDFRRIRFPRAGLFRGEPLSRPGSRPPANRRSTVVGPPSLSSPIEAGELAAAASARIWPPSPKSGIWKGPAEWLIIVAGGARKGRCGTRASARSVSFGTGGQ